MRLASVVRSLLLPLLLLPFVLLVSALTAGAAR